MNNLFNLLLILMCGISGIQALTADSVEGFTISLVALCLSVIIFSINTFYPLFKK